MFKKGDGGFRPYDEIGAPMRFRQIQIAVDDRLPRLGTPFHGLVHIALHKRHLVGTAGLYPLGRPQGIAGGPGQRRQTESNQ